MKKLSRELIRLAIEKKRVTDEMAALIDEIAPELDAFMREKYRDDPVKLAEWEQTLRISETPPRPKAKRAELPKKADD